MEDASSLLPNDQLIQLSLRWFINSIHCLPTEKLECEVPTSEVPHSETNTAIPALSADSTLFFMVLKS